MPLLIARVVVWLPCLAKECYLREGSHGTGSALPRSNSLCSCHLLLPSEQGEEDELEEDNVGGGALVPSGPCAGQCPGSDHAVCSGILGEIPQAPEELWAGHGFSFPGGSLSPFCKQLKPAYHCAGHSTEQK